MKEHRRVAERIAEIRHEQVMRLACGGPDFLEQEEELLEDLAAWESRSSVEFDSCIGEGSHLPREVLRKVDRRR